jgi:hypothetical protein
LTERAIRDALRNRVLAETFGARDAIAEFWVPRSNERTDMVVIGRSLDAFDIKSERDTLRRLPRQALAYERLFDHARRPSARRTATVRKRWSPVPEWWGITACASFSQCHYDGP